MRTPGCLSGSDFEDAVRAAALARAAGPTPPPRRPPPRTSPRPGPGPRPRSAAAARPHLGDNTGIAELARAAGLEQNGGTFGNSLSALRSNSLTEVTGSQVRADVFFLTASTAGSRP